MIPAAQTSEVSEVTLRVSCGGQVAELEIV